VTPVAERGKKKKKKVGQAGKPRLTSAMWDKGKKRKGKRDAEKSVATSLSPHSTFSLLFARGEVKGLGGPRR